MEPHISVFDRHPGKHHITKSSPLYSGCASLNLQGQHIAHTPGPPGEVVPHESGNVVVPTGVIDLVVDITQVGEHL